MNKMKFKILMICLICASFVTLIGCNKKKVIDLGVYLNSTLEYVKSNSKLELYYNDNGYYGDEAIQITVDANEKVNSIAMFGKKDNYNLHGITIGMSKEDVDKKIKELFTASPDIEVNETEHYTTYRYQQGNEQFSVVYETESSAVLRAQSTITNYTAGSTNENDILAGLNTENIIIRVGNVDVSYSEAMVYLKSIQTIYENEFGYDIWAYSLTGDGTTLGDMLKNEVLSQITQLKIICSEANKEGIVLSEDEMSEVRQSAANYIAGLSASDRTQYGITEELAVQVFADNALAKKVYETVTIDVDTEVEDEEAKKIKIYMLLLKNYGTDSKGNRTPLTSEDQEAVLQKMKELRVQGSEAEDFYSFAERNTEADTIEFVVGKTELEEPLDTVAFSLKTGELSKILETEDGYVILYCADDFDEDATLHKKEEIIEERRSKLFSDLYTEWSADYEIKVNVDEWAAVTIKPLSVDE